ncbi:MAG: hypothetical protein ACK2U6_13200, partial [Candidatus Promineifilaceae bacterium]
IAPPAPAQRRHRILRVAGKIIPPLQSAKAETQRQPRDRAPPVFADFTPAFPPILGRQRAWLLAFWRFDFFTM